MKQLKKRVDKLENRMDSFESKFEMYMQRTEERFEQIDRRLEEQRSEMRNLDNQRHAEIMALRAETDAKFGRIETKLDEMGKYIQNLTITAMIGIGGIAAAVIAFVYSIVSKGT